MAMKKLAGFLAVVFALAVTAAGAVAIVPSGAVTKGPADPATRSFRYAFHPELASTLSGSAAADTQATGNGFLGIFQAASTTPMQVSVNGAPPIRLGEGDFKYGLVAAGSYAISALRGGKEVATGTVFVGTNEDVTALIYLRPYQGYGKPTITGFVNDRSAPSIGQSKVVIRNTSTEPSVDVYLNGTEVASALPNYSTSPISVSTVVPSGQVKIVLTRHGQPITKPLYYEVGTLLPGNLLNVFVVGAFGTSYQFLTNSITLGAGYRLYAADGGVFSFGNAGFYGSMGGIPLNEPVVGAASTSVGLGYWEVAADGGIFSFGNAAFYGSAGDLSLNKPVVGMASKADDSGYWLVASDGGIFNYGGARFFGSMGKHPLNKPIVGMAATPDGKGYWLVASDGGVFSFGDAHFYGSMGGVPLNKPIVDIVPTADGGGYWLIASDGGVFSFGDATFYGSTGGMVLNQPVVSGMSTPDSLGYWLVASDGGVFSFGDAGFYGSTGSITLNKPVVAATGVGGPLG
jgi:hypothetical protein